MSDRRIDLDQAFADIAGVSPLPAAASRTLARTREAAVNAPRLPSHGRRWLWPASIAAAILLAGSVTLLLLPRPVSAQEALATTLAANVGYKGWVHVSTVDDAGGTTTIEHRNTQTGAFGMVIRSFTPYPPGQNPASAADTSPSTRTGASRPGTPPPISAAYYQNPVTGECADYLASSGWIRSGELGPGRVEILRQQMPVTYPDLLAQMKGSFGEERVKVTESLERGLKRFDLNAVPASQTAPETIRESNGVSLPATLWVDPKTDLIQEILQAGRTETLSYVGPEVTSIYDLGAPRDAKTFDNRPAKDAIAVYDQFMARVQKPWPDGLSVFLMLRSDGAQELQAYGEQGGTWFQRFYLDFHMAGAGGQGFEMPADWSGSGADEFLRRLALAAPHGEFSGNTQGARMRSGNAGEADALFAGPIATNLHHNYSPARRLFPTDAAEGRYGVDNHLETFTSPDHPGLAALATRYTWFSPDSLRATDELWMDPAHEYRPVTYTETAYLEPPKTGIYFKNVSEYGDYTQLPAPDGRWYPQAWTETLYEPDNDGKLAAKTVTKKAFRFFPGKMLPEVPEASKGLP